MSELWTRLIGAEAARSNAYHASNPRLCKSATTGLKLRARRRWHLARLALLRPDRSIDLHHQPVRLALRRLEHRDTSSPYCCRFYRALDQFGRAASLRFQGCLQVFDHRLELLVRQLLDQIALLNLVLARAQQRQNLQPGIRKSVRLLN